MLSIVDLVYWLSEVFGFTKRKAQEFVLYLNMSFKNVWLGLLTFLFIGGFSICAQEQGSGWIVGPSLSYQYQEKSFLNASFWGLTDLGYANYLRFDVGAGLTFQEKKTIVIPEASTTYYLSAKGAWPFVKAEFTPYTFTPKLGIGVFNILELSAGYGVKLRRHTKLSSIDGFSFQLGFNIPLNYYLK